MSIVNRPWRATARGIVVRVRLTPKTSTDAIDGLEDTGDGPAIKARVRALPSEGEANKAIEKLLASWLAVPKTAVAVTAGAKSRVKLLTVAGDPVVLERSLTDRLARLGRGEKG